MFNTTYEGKYFTVKHTDTVALCFEGSGDEYESYPTVHCETEADFEAFSSGEALAAFFDGECFVKVNTSEGHLEVMELSAANEFLASEEDETIDEGPKSVPVYAGDGRGGDEFAILQFVHPREFGKELALKISHAGCSAAYRRSDGQVMVIVEGGDDPQESELSL